MCWSVLKESKFFEVCQSS